MFYSRLLQDVVRQMYQIISPRVESEPARLYVVFTHYIKTPNTKSHIAPVMILFLPTRTTQGEESKSHNLASLLLYYRELVGAHAYIFVSGIVLNARVYAFWLGELRD